MPTIFAATKTAKAVTNQRKTKCLISRHYLKFRLPPSPVEKLLAKGAASVSAIGFERKLIRGQEKESCGKRRSESNCARYENRQRKTAAPIDRGKKGRFEEEQHFA